MVCDDEIIPSQDRIENAANADLEEVYDSERHPLMSLTPAPAIICW
jgi:hypothetical protein